MTEPSTSSVGEPNKQQTSKGLGAFYGALATVGSFVGGSIVGVVLLVIVTSFIEGAGNAKLADSISAVGGIVVLLPVAVLLTAAGWYWRKTPGFLLGIGLTIGLGGVVAAVLITAGG